eukprot:2960178-Lingulodinium_polyedra.AAC.1
MLPLVVGTWRQSVPRAQQAVRSGSGVGKRFRDLASAIAEFFPLVSCPTLVRPASGLSASDRRAAQEQT